MKTLTYILFFALLGNFAFSQTTQGRFRLDSLKRQLTIAKLDKNKVIILGRLSLFYTWSSPDTAILYAQQELKLAEELKFENGIANAQAHMGSSFTTLGNYPLAIDYLYKSIALNKKNNNKSALYMNYMSLVSTYRDFGDNKNSLFYARKILNSTNPNLNSFLKASILGVASAAYHKNNFTDSTILLAKQSYNINKNWSGLLYILGNAYTKRNQFDSSLFYYQQGIAIARKNHTEIDLLDIYNGISYSYPQF